MWILKHAFFVDTFQPMNAALTFQIGLNDWARAIRGKLTFADDLKSFKLIRIKYSCGAGWICLHLERGKLHHISAVNNDLSNIYPDLNLLDWSVENLLGRGAGGIGLHLERGKLDHISAVWVWQSGGVCVITIVAQREQHPGCRQIVRVEYRYG